ncbi:hypothetical protein IAT38_006339 [Cryptococcus sp. DSM 104549]
MLPPIRPIRLLALAAISTYTLARVHSSSSDAASAPDNQLVLGLCTPGAPSTADCPAAAGNPNAPVVEGTSGSRMSDLVDAVLHGGAESKEVGTGQGMTLADALTVERGASLWWAYARENSEITSRLDSRSKSSTLLVPVDKAILALDRKPHQPTDSSSPESATTRFLSAHIINGAVPPSGGEASTLLDGFAVTLVREGEGWKVQPGDVTVLTEKETANGKIMYLDGVLPYQ